MGTNFTVIARSDVFRIVAGAVAQADIVGADVEVLTAIGGSGTYSIAADVIEGTVVAIIAIDNIGRIITITVRIFIIRTQADIVGTDVAIATGIRRPGTNTVSTGIRMGAKIIIVTAGRIRGVGAFPIAKADIIGADIAIVAGIGRTPAGLIRANIGMGTGVVIITKKCIGRVVAGVITQADIICATVRIRAAIGRTVTDAIRALIRMGTVDCVITIRAV